jgi:hypothetical protein
MITNRKTGTLKLNNKGNPNGSARSNILSHVQRIEVETAMQNKKSPRAIGNQNG